MTGLMGRGVFVLFIVPALLVMVHGRDAAHAAEGPGVLVSSEPVRGLVEGVVSGVGNVVTLKEPDSQSEAPERAVMANGGPNVRVFVHIKDGPGTDPAAVDDGITTVVTLEGSNGQGAVWLDPDNARRWLNQIADALGQMDPINDVSYASNARGMRARIDALKSEINLMLLPVSDQTITVDTADLRPFANRFDLSLQVSEGGGACHVPLPPPLAETEDDEAASALVAVNHYIRLMREVARRVVECGSSRP